MTAPTPRGHRIVVTDPIGSPTTVTIYSDAEALAVVELCPASAVALAGDLIEAARIRLGRGRLNAEVAPA